MNVYYSLRQSDGINMDESNPVDAIMKTSGDLFYSMGIYRIGDDCIYLMHISEWDYDMLDAFGVDVITDQQFHKTYRLKTMTTSAHRYTGVEIIG